MTDILQEFLIQGLCITGCMGIVVVIIGAFATHWFAMRRERVEPSPLMPLVGFDIEVAEEDDNEQ